ncbi:DUF1858 domain-containing protein [uncultured Nitratireductor sp.]|uniref:DUF1858 domain-containing protein n=1 Tax=uncultured Nitratireductor sp. TaxID=520953 RepID=UPI0025DF1A2A|nr:DUF1858 domain-containing protein [uncultured Nitratireductor sp.]
MDDRLGCRPSQKNIVSQRLRTAHEGMRERLLEPWTDGILGRRNHIVTHKWYFISHFLRTGFPDCKCTNVAAKCGTPWIDALFAPAQSPGPVQVVSWFSLEMPKVKPPLTINPVMTVDEIMRRWPATIRVFIRNRMLCIGCPIGIFHTVKDACDAHRLDEEIFSRELLAVMKSDDQISGPSAFETTRTV